MKYCEATNLEQERADANLIKTELTTFCGCYFLNWSKLCLEMQANVTHFNPYQTNRQQYQYEAFTIYQFNKWLPHSQKGKMHRLATKPNISLHTIELICKCIVCLSEPGMDGQDGVSSSKHLSQGGNPFFDETKTQEPIVLSKCPVILHWPKLLNVETKDQINATGNLFIHM